AERLPRLVPRDARRVRPLERDQHRVTERVVVEAAPAFKPPSPRLRACEALDRFGETLTGYVMTFYSANTHRTDPPVGHATRQLHAARGAFSCRRRSTPRAPPRWGPRYLQH